MTEVLILLVSCDCDANMKMNKSEEEMNADYSKTVPLVSRAMVFSRCAASFCHARREALN
jgi:hypothetical protein